jgi:hypothetical protein
MKKLDEISRELWVIRTDLEHINEFVIELLPLRKVIEKLKDIERKVEEIADES